MTPRRKDSLKWTTLPEELIGQIENVFADNFPDPAKQGTFIAEGRIYKKELLFAIGYLPKDLIKQHNFVVSVEYNSQKDNFLNLVHLCVDVSANLLSEWWAHPEEPPTTDQWQEFKVQNQNFFVSYNTLNTHLESEANKLLGENTASDLINDSDQEDEVELKQKISLLGLDEDE